MFIGRKQELNLLENHYLANEGRMVILFGRRRLGKTAMLRHFSTGRRTLFYSCTETTDTEQLQAFSSMILNAGHPAAQYTDRFQDWKSAFLGAAELPGDERIILIIDEFPYMARENPEIPSILQNLWDHVLCKKNLLLILCGSSLSFMEKAVLSDKQPLYGRSGAIIRLQPLNYLESAAFFPDWSLEDKVRTYSILGGVPHYLKQFNPDASLDRNIIDQLLTNGSAMYNEVEFMMRQEFRDPGTYRAVLNAIASGATRLNEIAQKSLIAPNSLSTYLGNLIEVGLVEREFPVDVSTKEEGNTQRGLYRLTDPFFRFWFAFVRPHLGELDYGDAEGIYQHVVSSQLDYFSSSPFEKICVQFLRLHKNDLPFYFTRIGRWWYKNSELDILALNEDGSRMLGGECKYRNAPVNRGDVSHMMSKITPPRNATLDWCYFSRSGYTDEARAILGKYAYTLKELYD